KDEKFFLNTNYDNVIDADYNHKEIYTACKKALFNKNFIDKCHKSKNPYGGKLISKKYMIIF
mgnify:CR=1